MMSKRWQRVDAKGTCLEERYKFNNVVERSFCSTPKYLETGQRILPQRCIQSCCSGGPSPCSSQHPLPIYLLT